MNSTDTQTPPHHPHRYSPPSTGADWRQSQDGPRVMSQRQASAIGAGEGAGAAGVAAPDESAVISTLSSQDFMSET
jgi:hypothetical protein